MLSLDRDVRLLGDVVFSEGHFEGKMVFCHHAIKGSMKVAVADPGKGPGGPLPPPIRPDAYNFLHRQDCVALSNWLIFLKKRAWHFPTKLNARDIQKCNCFLVSSYDLAYKQALRKGFLLSNS